MLVFGKYYKTSCIFKIQEVIYFQYIKKLKLVAKNVG